MDLISAYEWHHALIDCTLWTITVFACIRFTVMELPSEFISITTGGFTISGFITLKDLTLINSGQECVIMIHDAIGNDVELGKLTAIFWNGELSQWSSPSIEW
ncbi:hypothetical protein [Deinococcus sonorensis]|uniref:Uncharacterized protein n=1 Tax=Deinococcus sonorensis TaxID=309891 RepID=A0ABV8YCR9_9DEIO